MDSLREQQVTNIHLNDVLSKTHARLENWKTKHESERYSWQQKLEETRTKFCIKLHEAEEQISRLNLRCNRLERTKQRLSGDIKNEFMKADALASTLRKKQETFDRISSVLQQRVNSLLAELEASKKICSNHEIELLKLRHVTQRHEREETKDRLEYSSDQSSEAAVPLDDAEQTCSEPPRIETIELSHESSGDHGSKSRRSRFRCGICKSLFTSISNLKRHQLLHTGEKPYSCDICGLSFNRKEKLSDHVMTHPGAQVRLSSHHCETCKRDFRSIWHLERHQSIHTSEKPYPCEICGLRFSIQDNLSQHVQKHMIRKPREHGSGNDLPITNTGPHQTDQSSQNHQKTPTRSRSEDAGLGSRKKYSCEFCEENFAKRAVLINHRRVHTGERPYMCEICGKAFKQSATLSRHRRIHTGEKRLLCSLSGERSKDSYHLRQHQSQHPDCADRVGLDSSENHHQRQQSQATLSRPESSQLPGSALGGTNDPSQNLREVHIQKDIRGSKRNLFCEFCGKSFKLTGQLKIHRRIHTGEKPYVCEFCGRGFKQSGSWQAHRRIHTGERPHSCDVCGKRFIAKVSLNTHIKSHHPQTNGDKVIGSKRFKENQHQQQQSHTPSSQPAQLARSGARHLRSVPHVDYAPDA